MNAIIVNDYAFVDGGASQIAIKTAVLLAKKGIKTCFFCGVGPIDKKLIGESNLRIVCLNQFDILNNPNRWQAATRGIWNNKAKNKFEEMLNDYHPKDSIIHIHTLSKSLSSSIVRVAHRKGYRIIYHLHDYGIACPNLGFYDYTCEKICNRYAMGMQCISHDCDSRKFSYKIWRVIRQFVQRDIAGIPKCIDGVISVSSFSWNILKKYIPKDKAVLILPNTISGLENCFVNTEENNTFIFIGRLSKEKNPMLLAKCAKQLNVPVIFIGDGPCKKDIMQFNKDAKITGWLSKNEMRKYIKRARCLVLTSNCYETQGMAVLEAAKCGIPSIVPNTSAATEFIKNKYNGLVFENNNMKSLLEKMEISLGQCQWGAIVDNLKKSSIGLDDDDLYIDQLIAFYNKLLR